MNSFCKTMCFYTGGNIVHISCLWLELFSVVEIWLKQAVIRLPCQDCKTEHSTPFLRHFIIFMHNAIILQRHHDSSSHIYQLQGTSRASRSPPLISVCLTARGHVKPLTRPAKLSKPKHLAL